MLSKNCVLIGNTGAEKFELDCLTILRTWMK